MPTFKYSYICLITKSYVIRLFQTALFKWISKHESIVANISLYFPLLALNKQTNFAEHVMIVKILD